MLTATSLTQHQLARLRAAALRQAIKYLAPTDEAVRELAEAYVSEALESRDVLAQHRVAAILCAAAPALLEAAKAVVPLAEGQTLATTVAAALHRLEAVAMAAAPPARVLQ